MSKRDKSKSFVIAIAGTSGAGKTSVVKKVTALLDDAVSFYFDDYSSMHQKPEDIVAWIEEGLDPHQWKNPRLLEDLRLLSHGTPVLPPDSNRKIKPARIIVMEEPFGRTREGMDQLVDFVGCIDLPLEIALARNISRDLNRALKEKTLDEFIEYLKWYLPWYLNESGRDLYYLINEKAKEKCELILDGTRPVAELAQEVAQSVNRIRGANK